MAEEEPPPIVRRPDLGWDQIPWSIARDPDFPPPMLSRDDTPVSLGGDRYDLPIYSPSLLPFTQRGARSLGMSPMRPRTASTRRRGLPMPSVDGPSMVPESLGSVAPPDMPDPGYLASRARSRAAGLGLGSLTPPIPEGTGDRLSRMPNPLPPEGGGVDLGEPVEANPVVMAAKAAIDAGDMAEALRLLDMLKSLPY